MSDSPTENQHPSLQLYVVCGTIFPVFPIFSVYKLQQRLLKSSCLTLFCIFLFSCICQMRKISIVIVVVSDPGCVWTLNSGSVLVVI